MKLFALAGLGRLASTGKLKPKSQPSKTDPFIFLQYLSPAEICQTQANSAEGVLGGGTLKTERSMSRKNYEKSLSKTFHITVA